MIEIHKPGSMVIVDGNSATVIAANINELGVSYEIAYWKQGERKTCWVYPSEIDKCSSEKTKIGFVP